MAGAQGTFLPAGSGWVPVVGDGPFTYRVAIEMDADLLVIGTVDGQDGVATGAANIVIQADGAYALRAGRDG